MANYVLPKSAPRAKSWVKVPFKTPCKINRWTYPVFTSTCSSVIWTHNGCLCNQIIALQYRHQIETPKCASLEEFNSIQQKLKPTELLQPWTFDAVCNTYTGAWRTKYLKAKKSLLANGLKPYHSNLTMFVKDDKEHGEPSKAGRAIQYRSPEFCLMQAIFTKPVEKWFYNLREADGSLVVGKCDGYKIAEALETKASNYKNPCFILLDASKFDTCVDIKWLKWVMKVIRACFPKKFWKLIYKLWSQTLINIGRTNKGLKYRTHGTRASGDMDTGLGNSIIMWSMLTRYLDLAGVKGSILVNGDDSVLVLDRSDLHLLDERCFKRWGFNMKREVVYSIDDVEFCQAKIVRTEYGVTMARNPVRVLRRTGWSTILYRDKASFARGLGLCENAASYGVPIAGVIGQKLMEFGSTRPRFVNTYMYDLFKLMDAPWKRFKPNITSEARVSYYLAWGITPADQIIIENSFKPTLTPVCTEEQISLYLHHTQGVC